MLKVSGADTTLTGAFHMDKVQMMQLSTAGWSEEAPVVMC
jgi:hypothetical protein